MSKEHKHKHEHSHNHNGEINSKEVILVISRLVVSVVFLIVGSIFLSINFYMGLFIIIASYIIVSYDILWESVENIFHGDFFDENFLMSIASIGAFFIGEYFEAAMVMILFKLGEFLQDLAVNKSRKSISSLVNLKPDYANLSVKGEISKVNPEKVNIGDIILIFPGEKIPLDGIVIEGESGIDTANLTGESIPRSVSKGDNVLSGCVNGSGELKVKVTASFKDSTVSKIFSLIEEASERKSSSENFITSFAKVYTPAVVFLAILIILIPPLFFKADDLSFTESILHQLRIGLSFLVVSCPCSLVISVPLAYFAGIGGASRQGILVKGGNYFDSLSRAEEILWDKTGTLTTGHFRVIVTCSVNSDFSEDDLLKISSHAEHRSTHPIARSICEAYKGQYDDFLISDTKVYDGKGIECRYGDFNVKIGNDKMFEGFSLNKDSEGTYCYIFINDIYSGYILISDTIKDNANITLSDLKALGIRENIMLTGDSESVAEKVAKELGIDKYHAKLLPSDKVSKLEETIDVFEGKGTVVFVGDGMNDAAALKRADVGIAMGALGSDAAIEAADVVILNDSLENLPKLIKIAKKTRKIATENIVFSLFVKVIILILIFLNLSTMYMAVFADVGVCLLAILNSLRALKNK